MCIRKVILVQDSDYFAYLILLFFLPHFLFYSFRRISRRVLFMIKSYYMFWDYFLGYFLFGFGLVSCYTKFGNLFYYWAL